MCLFNSFNYIVYRIYAIQYTISSAQSHFENHLTHLKICRNLLKIVYEFLHIRFFEHAPHQKLTHLNRTQYISLVNTLYCFCTITHYELLTWKQNQKLKWKCIQKETTNMHPHCLQRDLLVCGAATKCLKQFRNRHIIVSKVHSWDTIRLMVQWNIGQKLIGVMKKQNKIKQINTRTFVCLSVCQITALFSHICRTHFFSHNENASSVFALRHIQNLWHFHTLWSYVVQKQNAMCNLWIAKFSQRFCFFFHSRQV